MRAVHVRAVGDEPVLVNIDPPAAPAAGQTLIEVMFAAVGHLDRTVWSGRFATHPPVPYVPGVEGSGVVMASPSRLYEPGDRVWFRGGGLGLDRDGSWAERVVVPDTIVGILPAGVDFATGACWFSPLGSAWMSVHEIARVQPGERVLVTGATGAVGQVVTQLVAELGAEPIAVTAADPTGRGGPADVIIDCVGGEVLAAALPAVRAGGRAVLIGYTAGTTVTLDLPTFVQRDVSLLPLNMVNRAPAVRTMADTLLGQLADGRIHLGVRSIPIEEASNAFGEVVRRGGRGRVVIALR